ncbi:MAG: AAA family ATPase [Erythrobacter sp.]|jgi:type II secretory pathway predicted ATPase ExeA|nr:AAA family ATPase [Erythrobacter sp.]
MYDDHYGFDAKAFEKAPDPAFYFESVSHANALQKLEGGLEKGAGLIVIVGAEGTGKTTIAVNLLERADPRALTIAEIATPPADGEALLKAMADAFGVEVGGEDADGMLSLIARFLQTEARAGRRCLLVIDECQDLDNDTLKAIDTLSRLKLGSHPLLQTLLLGQTDFGRRLSKDEELARLRKRVIASHRLDALSEDEVEGYVRHRLSCAGWNDEPGLSADLFDCLFAETNGNPRAINECMERLLGGAARSDAEIVDAALLNRINAGEFEAEETGEPDFEPAGEGENEDVEESIASPTDGDTEEADAQRSSPDKNATEPASSKQLSALLTERDKRTADLEAAIGVLQSAGSSADTSERSVEELEQLVRRMEKRLEDQERSLRHVLTMLIEWLEDDEARRAA